MEALNLQFLYGKEFWTKLEFLLKNASERVFILSAFMGENTYKKYIKFIPDDVFILTVCREDSSYKPVESLKINHKYFHGKIYLIDNTIIIGSQNLYEANKEGEFSTLIETDSFNSSLILYQALLKIIEKEPIQAEPVDEDFISLYEDGCPFCGHYIASDSVSLHTCPGYGGDFVSDDDCESYGGDGFCKYCLPENRRSIGEAICCDDSGCGLGISLKTNYLLHHAINPVTKEEFDLARQYLRLFNFFAKQGEDAVEIFHKLGFVGEVYKINHERKQHKLVSHDVAQRMVANLQNRIANNQ
ncbi:hypothetical protein [Hymenobacter sp. IS2118]|uniref:hypothetical protein n=1 Tax=Hymenobacter sp. IS2118 TaxID=1505605 RepID=UPI0012687095|nr:hypothetical protein [Hymenobacter sp. IS2118]